MYKLISASAVCFFVFILWILYLANTGGNSLFFDFIRSIPYGDKLGHMGLFGFLTLAAVVGSKFRAFQCGKLNVYYGAVLVALFTISEEFSQLFIPSRTFDLLDLAANFVGIALAVSIAYLTNRYLIKRL